MTQAYKGEWITWGNPTKPGMVEMLPIQSYNNSNFENMFYRWWDGRQYMLLSKAQLAAGMGDEDKTKWVWRPYDERDIDMVPERPIIVPPCPKCGRSGKVRPAAIGWSVYWACCDWNAPAAKTEDAVIYEASRIRYGEDGR